MRQYFDSLSPAYDTSSSSSISTPSQLPRSSPVPVLHRQRTGSSQSIFPFYSFPDSLGWSYIFSFRSQCFDNMLYKSLIASIFLLASISSTNAHAGVNPTLGVKGQMV